MRFGENPRTVIERVREKLRQIEPGLKGVRVVPVYDRTGLIDETVATLTESLKEELVHHRRRDPAIPAALAPSLIVAVTMPMAVLASFIGMRWFGIDANIMSLAGIAIAIGEVADLSIIISENVYQHLVDWEKDQAQVGVPDASSGHVRDTPDQNGRNH